MKNTILAFAVTLFTAFNVLAQNQYHGNFTGNGSGLTNLNTGPTPASLSIPASNTNLTPAIGFTNWIGGFTNNGNGLTILTKNLGVNIPLWVDTTNGNDANAGTNPATAVKTLEVAFAKANTNYPNNVLLSVAPGEYIPQANIILTNTVAVFATNALVYGTNLNGVTAMFTVGTASFGASLYWFGGAIYNTNIGQLFPFQTVASSQASTNTVLMEGVTMTAESDGLGLSGTLSGTKMYYNEFIDNCVINSGVDCILASSPTNGICIVQNTTMTINSYTNSGAFQAGTQCHGIACHFFTNTTAIFYNDSIQCNGFTNSFGILEGTAGSGSGLSTNYIINSQITINPILGSLYASAITPSSLIVTPTYGTYYNLPSIRVNNNYLTSASTTNPITANSYLYTPDGVNISWLPGGVTTNIQFTDGNLASPSTNTLYFTNGMLMKVTSP